MFKSSPTNWSATIKTLRADLSLTQEQLAAKLGVAFSTVSRWENGRGNPSPLAIKRIEQLCRVQRQEEKAPKAASEGDT
ncbi:MAG: helix-turn-helix domain-containing protein [Planctomycetes bacterium]|nr:helix-turn-helix domain-containing protein [Planctomycetota bacterium]